MRIPLTLLRRNIMSETTVRPTTLGKASEALANVLPVIELTIKSVAVSVVTASDVLANVSVSIAGLTAPSSENREAARKASLANDLLLSDRLANLRL